MIEEVTRHCPNCKTEITVIFEEGPQGEDAIKKCPVCESPILFCPDGYIVQAVTAFASRLPRTGSTSETTCDPFIRRKERK